jgi:hypothetical protein
MNFGKQEVQKTNLIRHSSIKNKFILVENEGFAWYTCLFLILLSFNQWVFAMLFLTIKTVFRKLTFKGISNG